MNTEIDNIKKNWGASDYGEFYLDKDNNIVNEYTPINKIIFNNKITVRRQNDK